MRTSDFIARGGLWVVTQFILLGMVGVSPWVMPRQPMWTGQGQVLLGYGFAVAGLALFTAGLLGLGSSVTPMPHPRKGSVLRTGGAYRYVRHPIYGGIILAVLGYCLMHSSVLLLIFPVLVLILFDRKAIVEERFLRLRYPDYEAFAATRKKLIPWVY